jgi:NADPH:quinone reductase-like Zn-dependent oxidoreductase
LFIDQHCRSSCTTKTRPEWINLRVMNPMTTGTMLAAVFDRAGPLGEVVRVREVPIPVPGPGEVLVRVHAASIHPADGMFAEGRYRVKPRFPQVAGLVGSGTIVDDDRAAQGLAAGTRVAFRRAGAWAEYCCVPLDRIYKVPGGVHEQQAAQFALNPLTACGLLDMAGVREGDWVAINAAGSNVARLARELARSKGVHVIGIHRKAATDAGPADILEGDDLAARLTAAAGGPIAALLDCVGGQAITTALPALRQGAAIVSYGMLGRDAATMSNADIVYRNLRWCGFGIDHWLNGLGPRTNEVVQSTWDAVQAGLQTPVAGVYPLAQIEQALTSAVRETNAKTIMTML